MYLESLLFRIRCHIEYIYRYTLQNGIILYYTVLYEYIMNVYFTHMAIKYIHNCAD